MVVDVARDRIRHQVAERATGRRASAKLGGGQPHCEAIQEDDPLDLDREMLDLKATGPASG